MYNYFQDEIDIKKSAHLATTTNMMLFIFFRINTKRWQWQGQSLIDFNVVLWQVMNK
jgi:hypothetical protein